MKPTPIIKTSEIKNQRHVGFTEINEESTDILEIEHTTGRYLVAGAACNTGLIALYARKIEEFNDSELGEFISDLIGDYPSAELLSFHGSMVI